MRSINTGYLCLLVRLYSATRRCSNRGGQMLNTLRTALKELFDLDDKTASDDPQAIYSLASAALMVEVIAADYERQPQEREALLGVLRRNFGLDATAADALLARGEQAHQQSTDYFRFTSQINRHCTPEQKVALIEGLWQVAFADGELHHYEEHVIRRIADLIHVPHMAFIAAKHRAEGSA
jgi:uncharacterized tellurite resistance protein B-like protein